MKLYPCLITAVLILLLMGANNAQLCPTYGSCAPNYPCTRCDGFCTVCSQCSEGYMIYNSNCEPCSYFGCTECGPNGCLGCETGFLMVEGTCKPCENIFSGCSSCISTGCTQCMNGYYLNGDSCESCGGNFASICASCNANGCLSCPSTSYLVNNICNLCTDTFGSNCESCNSSACTSCAPNTILRYDQCLACGEAITGCITCGSSFCTLCKADYFYSNGLCINSISGNISSAISTISFVILVFQIYPLIGLPSKKNSYTDLENARSVKRRLYITFYLFWAIMNFINFSNTNETNSICKAGCAISDGSVIATCGMGAFYTLIELLLLGFILFSIKINLNFLKISVIVNLLWGFVTLAGGIYAIDNCPITIILPLCIIMGNGIASIVINILLLWKLKGEFFEDPEALHQYNLLKDQEKKRNNLKNKRLASKPSIINVTTLADMFYIEIHLFETLQYFKEQLEAKMNVQRKSITVEFKGARLLDDERTLLSYGIEHKSNIIVRVTDLTL